MTGFSIILCLKMKAKAKNDLLELNDGADFVSSKENSTDYKYLLKRWRNVTSLHEEMFQNLKRSTLNS